MEKRILALDQGTTSSRAMVFGRDGRPVAVAQEEFAQILPASGVVEHDPEVLWASQLRVAREALALVARCAADCRDRDRQSAGDDDPLGPRYGPAGSKRHRLAKPREAGAAIV